ncbi:uncharacterized protein HMPREF1541_03823 [Cyphellophora europaea CBS 101466]|uniref:Stress-response A/B barrel domain-containing protein n=1 Tax=Cyphellophora europaea (strain CBS 101466) TaxID=1220924 RepID=W2S1R9_CYPE1|nr:uncharacterized protein HMPREF1541_03823 [Cyphellophora europaea CBS 101466]ETN41884.1 hypothetical protein HMPREF1541_03823 [Cyphellophora europaea CBS 101466]
MPKYVKRITLFKIPEQHIDSVLAAYVVLRKNAKKVSYPIPVLNTRHQLAMHSSSSPALPLPRPPPPPPPQQVPWLTPSPATQDGRPYIVSNESRRVSNTDSPISDGFTVVSQTIFANWEDANFYDKKCPAHLELKKVTGPVRTGVQTIIYESEVGVEGAKL